MKTELPDGYSIFQIAMNNGFTYRLGNAGIHSIQNDDSGYVCYGREGMMILVEDAAVCAVELRTLIKEGVPATKGAETNANRRTLARARRDTHKQEQLPIDYDNRGNK